MALDWLKNGMQEMIVKIEIGPIGAFREYNVPEWAGEKTGDIALLHPANKWGNPILVTQRSVLRALESICVEKEAEGAVAKIVKVASCQKAVLEVEEGELNLSFTRDEKKGKFAPYEVKILE